MGETTRRIYTDEQRRARAEYMRRAEKLRAEAEAVDGDNGGGH